MASEISAQTNGYGAHHHAASDVSLQTGNSASVNGSTESPSPSKDEIGWYFVEQYYTTLSKNPEKLHLFYAKRSQFVSGLEAEKAPVCVGQRAIADRIKELDIQEAKVRVTNVDSQESGRDIVAQVIGEMSTKGLPHRKFVQTFILAEQPNGYYVLNDIFRYIAEEEEEEQVEEQTPEETVEADPAPIPAAPRATLAHEDSIEVLDKKLEETVAEPEVLPTVVAASQNASEPEDTPLESAEVVKEVAEDKPASPEEAIQAVDIEEEQAEEEAPKDPEPTPAPPSPVKTPAVPAAAPVQESAAPAKAAPSAPKTWASMLAGSKTVAVPQIPASAAQPKSTTKSTPAPAAAGEAISAPGVANTLAGLSNDSEVPPSPGGWQTAGQDHHRKQHRQQPSSLGGQAETTSAYIKNVTEKVDASILKQTLSKFGKLAYFDVSRPKNCAFVEFDTQAAFQAAVAANPHVINSVEVIVAERLRAGNGFPRGGMRGGRGGMENRTNSQGGRGGFNKDARGNFANRGARGGAPMAQRGRPTQV